MQVTSPGPEAGKPEWRRWFRRILADIADQDTQSGRIREQLAGILESKPCRCVATFSALAGEPSLLDLVSLFPSHRWVLPRVDGDHLVFHEVDHPDQLQTGAFGIAEPGPDLPVVRDDDIDTFLCPGLGFDQHGIRLGRGKGFYDRALENAQADAQRIGIAFREQIVDRLPADPHDVPMNLILSGSE
ncbi:5-formyltetrahydrofolate cyclo-ligase [Haloferula sp.]|uniref:5-formyltetrahydrofolate cyclo-ligase n=1 Tax=Haloferula sp. TaxID=2497595 RepID=UPI00329B7504